jgi:hypothetical protein
MGIHGGPNLIKDNLLFGYDTGYGVADNDTATRFYPGAPTTNLNTDPYHSTRSDGDTISSSTWGGDTGSAEFKTNTSPDGGGVMYVNKNTSNPAGSGGVYNDFPSTRFTLTNGVTYTRSWWCKSNINQTLSGHICSCNRDSTNTYIVGSNISLTTDWQRITETFTYTGPTSTDWQFRHINYNASEVYIANVQLEANNFASPFINQSRSDTASLIDLKRTTDIDVSNISFDSTGQPEFDGTDDVISIDVDDIVRQSTNITIEGIVELGSITSAGPWSIMTDHASSNDRDGFWWHMNISGSVYFRVEDNVNGEQGTVFSGGVPFIANTTQHIVTIVGALGVFIYVNGELSKTYTPSFKWSQIDSSKTAYLTIGRTYPNYFLNSKNRVVKMYNRALTAEEIKKNFNVYKNRFNI